MAGGFSVVIAAVDNVSATVEKINKKFTSMTAPVTRLNASFKKFSDVSGLKSVYGGVEKLGGGMVRLAKSASMVVAPLGAITSAASLAGVIALTERFGDFGSQLGFTAANIGISAQSLHGLEGAARLAGASGASAASGMLNLSQAITDAAGGRNMEALGYFRQLGINIRDANGALRTADQVLPDVADGIAKISNPALQRRVAGAFGLSDDMLPFLRRGSAGLREYNELAKRYGVINDDGVRSAMEMRQAQTALALSVEGLGYSVGEKLSPVLSPLLTQLADWIAKHRTDIADAIGGIAKQFDAWVKGDGIGKTVASLQDFAARADQIVQIFGGWKVAAEALGVVLVARVLAPLASLLGIFARLALAAPPWLIAAIGLGAGVADIAKRGPTGNIPDNNFEDKGLGRAPGERAGTALPPTAPNTAGQAISDWWHNMTMPRGIRNNNPLNLSYVPGQGAAQSDGRFGQYTTMEGGIAAGQRQLIRYGDQGDNSLIKMIRRWAPPSENDTNGYIHAVSEETGFDPDQALDMRDPTVAAKVMRAMSQRENGRGATPDLATFGRGTALNAPAPGPYSQPPATIAGTPGAAGSVNVVITHANAPPGTAMKTTTSGNVNATAKVQTTALLDPH